MENSIRHTEDYAYRLNAENVTLQLLIDTKIPAYVDAASGKNLVMMTDHTHVYTEFFICREGEMRLHTADGIITLQAGDAAILPPHTPHRSMTARNHEIWDVLSFSLVQNGNRGESDLYELLSPFLSGARMQILRGYPELCRYVSEIRDEIARDRRTFCVLMLLHMLVYVAERCVPAVLHTVEVPTIRDSEMLLMGKLGHIIQSEFARNLRAAEVAEALYVSERQLDRIMKKYYGATLREVIAEKRVTTAESLLRTSDFSAEKIALIVGFSSKAGFWREFSRKYGVTPAKYRQIMRQETASQTADRQE